MFRRPLCSRPYALALMIMPSCSRPYALDIMVMSSPLCPPSCSRSDVCALVLSPLCPHHALALMFIPHAYALMPSPLLMPLYLYPYALALLLMPSCYHPYALGVIIIYSPLCPCALALMPSTLWKCSRPHAHALVLSPMLSPLYTQHYGNGFVLLCSLLSPSCLCPCILALTLW